MNLFRCKNNKYYGTRYLLFWDKFITALTKLKSEVKVKARHACELTNHRKYNITGDETEKKIRRLRGFHSNALLLISLEAEKFSRMRTL